MARVLYLGPPSAVRLPDRVTSGDLLSRLGRNTGNLLFGDAIQRHLAPNVLCRLDDLLRSEDPPLPIEALDPADLEARFDAIVIGAANFLHPASDFTHWARFLESVRLPTTIIGLGAQAPDYAVDVSVPAGTERLVRLVAERSKSLGARGAFTASVLERLGITNVRVIGCPSMFWSCQPTLSIEMRPNDRPVAVWVNGSANVVGHAGDVAAATRVEMLLARLSFEHGYPYVLQNESELMDILFDAPGACEASLVGALAAQYGLPEQSPAAFIDFVRRHTRVYASTRTWIEAASRCDLVVGTRFHGTLVGLLAGVPGLVFVHDARTREMCEFLQIPHRDVRSVETIDIELILHSLDVAPLNAAYPGLFRNYVEFLDENGLEHALPH